MSAAFACSRQSLRPPSSFLQDGPWLGQTLQVWRNGPAIQEVETALLISLRYLDSDQAERSIEVNPYWPMWNSPCNSSSPLP